LKRAIFKTKRAKDKLLITKINLENFVKSALQILLARVPQVEINLEWGSDDWKQSTVKKRFPIFPSSAGMSLT